MRALMLDPPEWFLEERSRLGHDRRDEVWDGVLHMVPQPSFWHQEFNYKLIVVLGRIAESLGWHIAPESSLFDPTATDPKTQYRVPDLSVAKREHISDRGIEARAELVVEILSPNDESRDKFPFYAKCGVQEIWLVHRDERRVEVYVLRGATYFAVLETTGRTQAPSLGLTLSTVAGPKLRIEWTGGSAEI